VTEEKDTRTTIVAEAFPCPLCGQSFSAAEINEHAATCAGLFDPGLSHTVARTSRSRARTPPLRESLAEALPSVGSTVIGESERPRFYSDPNRFRSKKKTNSSNLSGLSLSTESSTHEDIRISTTVPSSDHRFSGARINTTVSSSELASSGCDFLGATSPSATDSLTKNPMMRYRQRSKPSLSESMSISQASTERRDPEWWWLSGEQKKPFKSNEWKQYSADEQKLLTTQYIAMQAEGRSEGLLADLGSGGLQIKCGRPKQVHNRDSPLHGCFQIAGYSADLWDVPSDQLPLSPLMDSGRVMRGYYQVRAEDNRKLDELEDYLGDPNRRHAKPGNPRRRVVILIIPYGWHPPARTDRQILGGGASLALPIYWAPSAGRRPQVLLVRQNELDALKLCIKPGGTLGGADMRQQGQHSGFEVVGAWRLQHPGLWAKYAAERENIRSVEMPSLESNGIRVPAVKIRQPFEEMKKRLPGNLDSSINELYLVHGTRPESILAILAGGLNERFSGGLFGSGTYFAEDVAKSDQYCTPDNQSADLSDLHKELYDNLRIPHPGECYYFFICRVVLGHAIHTKDGHVDESGRNIWSINHRELSIIRGSSPPVIHHSLVAETGAVIQRFREIISFHGDRIFPEYLVAYHRVSSRATA